jgi:hypothetical protein
MTTPDVEHARLAIADAGFLEAAFGSGDTNDEEQLHQDIIEKLLREVTGWRDRMLP